MLHALTGCDTVSFFSGKGKRTAWDTWSVFPAATDVLADLSSVPESIPDDYMPWIERFVVLLYSRTSTALTVNEARQELILWWPMTATAILHIFITFFSKKNNFTKKKQ